MTREDIKELLNKQYINIQIVRTRLIEYILESPNKERIINHIVTAAKNKRKFTNTDLFKFFFEATEDLVKDTRHIKTVYSAQTLLKTVWDTSNINQLVINNIRDNFKLFDIEEPKELTREEQLVLQAQRMREAKAKKAAERKAKKAAEQQRKLKEVKPTEPVVQQSKYTKEQLEQIELLRNLSL